MTNTNISAFSKYITWYQLKIIKIIFSRLYTVISISILCHFHICFYSHENAFYFNSSNSNSFHFIYVWVSLTLITLAQWPCCVSLISWSSLTTSYSLIHLSLCLTLSLLVPQFIAAMPLELSNYYPALTVNEILGVCQKNSLVRVPRSLSSLRSAIL